MRDPALVLVTGIMAAGKSSVAQRLAERLPRSVHLRGDLFRRMIVNGRVEMGFELDPEAEAQLRLRYRIAATVAHDYLQAGFTVVYQDIIIGSGLTAVIQQYQAFPLHVVVLCPDPAVVAVRETERPKWGYGEFAQIAAFDHVLRTETPRIGLWLDSSHLSLDQTVDQILERLDQALVVQETAADDHGPDSSIAAEGTRR